jgi:sec-independent protein translocase protein TatC
MALLKSPNPLSSSDDPTSELRATLAEHLEEFRQRILRVLGAAVLATVVAWFFTNPVFEIFKAMALAAAPKGVEIRLVFMGVSSSFMFQLTLAFAMGLGVVIPYAVSQIWGFIKPGLKPHERRPLRFVAPISTLLFAGGCTLAWFVLPVTLKWFFYFVVGFAGTEQIIEVSEMIFFPVSIILSFGVAFQMPIVIYFLSWLGIVSPAMLLRYWRHGIIAVVTASAIITPSGDIPTLMMMSVPLTILYFATILAASLNRRRGDSTELDDLD